MIALAVDELRPLGELWSRSDEVAGVEIDSRRVGPGDLFVAVGGGVAYVDDARAAGATATLVPTDAFAAMGEIARRVRARSAARVVGITGSTGKTSTKDILAALLAPHANVVAAEGGHNNEIGLPLTLCRIERETELVVAEMGMRGRGQIAELAQLARPRIAIVTSIGPVHLELLGTVENVARAKAEILHALPEHGVGIVPGDAPELDPFIPDGIDIRRFDPPDMEVRDGWAYVRFRGREIPFSFTARHQATNAVAALLAVEALGLPLPDGPVEVTLSRWRGEESELPGGGLLINDCYNANPVSMRAALEHLLARAEGRRTVAVLGEMAELGTEAPRYHEAVAFAAADVDVVVGVGELARRYDADEWVGTAAEAVSRVRAILEPGDVVLVKGSRAVGLEVVADAVAGALAS
ncbi:MAG TPA: UDP-N-acetylmuramoyl-tripeptide--D-alanyl-D-alanine ligase [Gaiella sp.]